MANNEDGDETVSRGNEWEVVSLTASAYAAAPGPKQEDLSHESSCELGKEKEAETSSTMFMSGHFIFPPNQHENLPLKPEYSEIHNEKVGEYDVSQLITGQGNKSDVKDEENVSIKGLMSDDFPEIPIFDEKGNMLSVSGANFEKGSAFDKEQSIYSTAEFSPLHSEATMVRSNTVEEGEKADESLDHESDSGLPGLRKAAEGDKYDDDDLPCEAWWKRRAVSLYAHAKEANTFWSIFVAAAVMGFVIIGHRWQQERWKVLHLKWQFGINDERMGTMLGPLSRFKDVIVGSHRRGSLVRGSTSTER